jgi:hypothetical protein
VLPTPETGVVAGPVQAGAFFIALARLATAARSPVTAAFPVTVSKTARVADGVIRQLLICPRTVGGMLVYRTRSDDAPPRRLARKRFTCTRPSEVVRIAVPPASRSRLAAPEVCELKFASRWVVRCGRSPYCSRRARSRTVSRSTVRKGRKPQARLSRRSTSRWRRFVTWLSQTHPIGRALVGLVAPAAAIIAALLALGLMSPASASEQLAKSASASIRAGTSSVVLRVAAQVQGEAITFSAYGQFDYQSRRGRMTYNFAHIEGLERAVGVEGRFDNGVAYIRLPTDMLRRGDPPWVQVDLSGIDQLLRDIAEAGISPNATRELSVLADVSLADPSGVLRELERAGNPRKLGEAIRHGIRTQGYAGTLVLRGGTQHVRATAWIDDDDMVRQLELDGDGQDGKVRAEIEFPDYGVPVDVDVPKDFMLASDLYSRLAARG